MGSGEDTLVGVINGVAGANIIAKALWRLENFIAVLNNEPESIVASVKGNALKLRRGSASYFTAVGLINTVDSRTNSKSKEPHCTLLGGFLGLGEKYSFLEPRRRQQGLKG